MAGRAIPRTFPRDESSFFTDAGQFALALFLQVLGGIFQFQGQ